MQAIASDLTPNICSDTSSFPLGMIKLAYDRKKIDILSANDYFFSLFGMTRESYSVLSADKYGARLALTADFSDAFKALPDPYEIGSELTYYFKAKDKDGELIYIGVSAKLTEVRDEVFYFDVCVYGIDWIVNRLTNYDRLTGAPKSHIFNSSFMEDIAEANDGDRFAVVSADLNNFKLINEKIGGDKGDKVLINLSLLLGSFVKGRGRCSRAFADKYVLYFKCLPGEDIKTDMENLINDFTKRMSAEFDITGLSMSVGIFIVEAPDDNSVAIFVDKANIARKNAKAAQNAQENSCVIYLEEMKTELDRAMQITGEAVRAIQNREFIVYYQPKISLKNKSVVGAEALVRWKKPDGTLVPPGMFLPYLEKSSFIKEVDFYVYDEVCCNIRDGLNKGKTILPVSVNVSRVHLKDDDFIEKVKHLVEKYDIPPKFLEFELTENAFLDDEYRAVQIMTELREIGFLVSIDDFGSGYSSLNLLKTLPVDILKLDRAFFGRSDLKENNAIVVTSIIDMANQMKISVICEGVETAEQVEFLKRTECDSVQGFYYAKAIPPGELESFRNEFEKQ
ncbi:MAG: bifunctional diguanylate cyclase/phosphodiesterase [Oscillospiraceae bacterium]|nr:bifunctional diguanylate cyclase/phosphodiesterase [Oscillospiraceae bacterium]